MRRGRIGGVASAGPAAAPFAAPAPLMRSRSVHGAEASASDRAETTPPVGKMTRDATESDV